jgi:hypothetical protein
MRFQGVVGVLFESHKTNAVPFHRYINYTETVSTCLSSSNSSLSLSASTWECIDFSCSHETCASCRWSRSCLRHMLQSILFRVRLEIISIEKSATSTLFASYCLDLADAQYSDIDYKFATFYLYINSLLIPLGGQQ